MSETENPNFRLKSIAEFLDDKHHFFIPSYQRGYRWDQRQVEDLLKDIYDFAKKTEKKLTDFYCLQPIVVKRNENLRHWEVIDGQQRLTTLLLILQYLKSISNTPFIKPIPLYDITYQTRSELDFVNPNLSSDIDSFHVFHAKKFIEQWVLENQVRSSLLEEVLFLNPQSKQEDDQIPQVKFIWYVAKTDYDVESIKIFNNLNKGKIGLTNSELIKALFVLKAQEKKRDKKTEEFDVKELTYEWNLIENELQDNRFWYFLTNKNYNPSTRIDLIFDFLTGKTDQEDGDYSYRRFQDLYDHPDDFWEKKDISNFTTAWKKVKEVYDTFRYWYEENTVYHYVGYLVVQGVKLDYIYSKCVGLEKPNLENKLKELIKDKLPKIRVEELKTLTYTEQKKECNQILLLFNIQTCIDQLKNLNDVIGNQDKLSYYKFPFDLYKQNNWDIEHVGSQKENDLRDIKDKIVWLGFIEQLEADDKNWKKIKQSAIALKIEMSETLKDEKDVFKDVYNEICSIFQQSRDDSKDTLENLTLLDEGTNRGYKNALFPTKRRTIIDKDMNGVFIPVCTRNLFLKYYSKDERTNSQWKNTWNDIDRKAYLGEIVKQLGPFLQ
jgi:uncharacterized protein with ParB-like and HNH nuclease domain